MRLTEKQLNAIRNILIEKEVSLAYVFGSFARGTAGSGSDLDIAVEFRDSVPMTEYFSRELSIAREISELIKREVDVINLETINRPVLKHRAVFQGQCILSENPKKQYYIERAILREYEDTAMLRRVQSQIRHRHIKEGTFGKPAVSVHTKYK